MKPEIVYIIASDNSIVEEGTKKLTLVGLFKKVNILEGSLVTTIPSMTIVARIANAEGKKNAEIRITDPENQPFASAKLTGEAPKGDLDLRAVFSVVEFRKLGKYRIEIILDDEMLETNKHHFFEVALTDQNVFSKQPIE